MARPSTNGERSRQQADEAASERMRSAGVRAADAHRSVRRRAQKLSEELDEVTAPHGIPTTELHDEDSLVIATVEAITANTK